MSDQGENYRIQIQDLRAQVRHDRREFASHIEPPDEPQAMVYLREGVGPAIWLYIEALADNYAIPPDEYSHLQTVMNEWFELYSKCYGVSIDATFTLPTAAKLLLQTHNIRDTAQILTQVPSRTVEH